MAFAILDTGVYIDHWERGRHWPSLQQIMHSFVVRQSAVVLSELRRGARTRAARAAVESLRHLAPEIWAPNGSDWWTASELIQSIGDAHDWETHKRREFQNDALIALTALRHGARIVTTNAADFKLLARKLHVEIVAL